MTGSSIESCSQRTVRARALTFAAMLILSCAFGTSAYAQTCPNPDPTVDYNCPLGPTYVIPGLTDLAGWNQANRYTTLATGDLDGDGKDELVVRGPAGIDAYRFNSALGQWSLMTGNHPYSDVAGWVPERYYSTIKLAAVSATANHARQLVARAALGIEVSQFIPGSSPDIGSWSYLSQNGPMADTACFFNHRCWGDDPGYYSTIQIGDESRFGRAVLVGRGGDGLEAYFWNGHGWDPGAPVLADLSDVYPWDHPKYYSNIFIFPASNGIYVAVRTPSGMTVYNLDTSGGLPGVWKAVAIHGPMGDASCFSGGHCWGDGPQYWSTIRPYPSASGLFSVIGRGADGLEVWNFGLVNGAYAWTRLGSALGPFSDADGFDQAQYYATLRIADIDGDGNVEVLGRASTGMAAYGFNGASWSPAFQPGQPQLADAPWASDPAYYTTLRLAHLTTDGKGNGTGPALLLGRNASGVRTWQYAPASRTWGRYLSYGSYPVIAGATLSAVDKYLGIANGTIRDVYTSPASSPSSSQLQGFQNSLAQTCSNPPLSADPPQYSSCTQPVGATVGNSAWTAAANELMAELFWATQVVNRFATLTSVQTQLFIDQNSEFPSIAADLKLGNETQTTVASVDYLGLFGSIFEFLGGLQIPGISTLFSLTGDAMAIGQAATPTLSGSKPSKFDQAYSQIEGEIATIQQETQTALAAHQHYVLADYGLLATVGHLVSSQIWQLDTAAAMSASRQQFTQWVYKAFLPAIWDYWDINYCNNGTDNVGRQLCNPPPNDAGTFSFSSGNYNDPGGEVFPYESFTALLPRQAPCAQGYDGNYYCTFQGLVAHGYGPTLGVLTKPITEACTYNPSLGTAWQYGTCNLGVPNTDLAQQSIWGFAHYACGYDYQDTDNETYSNCPQVQPSLLVSGSIGTLGTTASRVDLVLAISTARVPDLRNARIALYEAVREAGGAEELLERRLNDASAPVMEARTQGERDHATFSSWLRQWPRMYGNALYSGGVLHIVLRIDGGKLRVPQGCTAGTVQTPLTTRIVIEDGAGPPLVGLVTMPWQCVAESNGDVRQLRWPHAAR